MLPLFVYSHSDFDDILKIQTDYVSNVLQKFLIINHTNNIENSIILKYDGVYHYDDSLPYATRLLNVLNQIDHDYLILTHENDILLSLNDVVLQKISDLMKLKNIDRVTLQCCGGNAYNGGKEFIQIDENANPEQWIEFNHGSPVPSDKEYLGLHNTPHTYQYSVNPSIWNRKSLVKLLTQFKHSTYRSIENDVVDHMHEYKIYNLVSPKPLRSGYQKCLNLYKYLHITHYGLLLRYDNSKCTQYNDSYEDLYDDYKCIIEKYDLLNGKRKFS